jgi:general stress protein CsbA
MLTYINYSYPSYFENLWIVILEYFAVIGYLIYEISKNVKHSMIPVMVKTETPD